MAVPVRLEGVFHTAPMSAQAKTLKIAVTTTATTAFPLPDVGHILRVVNDGSATAFIAVSLPGAATAATTPGTTVLTALGTSTPILAGEDATFSLFALTKDGDKAPTQPFSISAITAVGTTTLYVQVGEGM